MAVLPQPKLRDGGTSKRLSPMLEELLGQIGVGRKGLDTLSRAALGQQLQTRNEQLQTLEKFGAGERAFIEQGFSTQLNNLLGRLETRGLGGSSVALTGGLASERERQLALGALNDRILGRRLDILGGAGAGISGLLASFGQQRTQARLQERLQEQQIAGQGRLQAASPENTRLQAILGSVSKTASEASALSGPFSAANLLFNLTAQGKF